MGLLNININYGSHEGSGVELLILLAGVFFIPSFPFLNSF